MLLRNANLYKSFELSVYFFIFSSSKSSFTNSKPSFVNANSSKGDIALMTIKVKIDTREQLKELMKKTLGYQ